MTATDELCRRLDERGVEWDTFSVGNTEYIHWTNDDGNWCAASIGGPLSLHVNILDATPEQAIAATLGREPWINPTWERWHKSLKHDEIKSIGDAVEQLMYEAIEFGGDMGPNGNTYNGIDEGDVLTSGFIDEWIMRFESTLGRDKYSYKQWREISNAVGDAMEYAHNKAIECPDKADPLWNLDEYVNRILKAAFEGEATLGDADATGERHGVGTCQVDTTENWLPAERYYRCKHCGAFFAVLDASGDIPPHFCPNCGSRVVAGDDRERVKLSDLYGVLKEEGE